MSLLIDISPVRMRKSILRVNPAVVSVVARASRDATDEASSENEPFLPAGAVPSQVPKFTKAPPGDLMVKEPASPPPEAAATESRLPARS